MEDYSEWFMTLTKLLGMIPNIKINEYLKEENYDIVLFNYKNIHGELHMTNESFICLSMTPESNELREVIKTFFQECFGVEPCLSYIEKTEDGQSLYCTEWVSYDRDAHILRFMNSYNKGLVLNTSNVKILTDKSKSYYEDRLTKISGIYQGDLTDEESEFYKTCSEYNLYSELKRRTLKLKMLNSDIPDEEIDVSDYDEESEELRFSIEYLLVQTARFNTGIKPSTDYSEINIDMDYMIWLNSWDRYINEVLDREDVMVLEEMATQMEDVYPYLVTINSNMYTDGIKHIYINKRLLEQ